MAKFFPRNNKGNLNTYLSPFNFKVNFIKQTTVVKMMHFQDQLSMVKVDSMAG